MDRDAVDARVGNGRLQLTADEVAVVQELVDELVHKLRRFAGVDVVELELELGRRAA